ncbi:MAG: peptidoglycan DD-metalloendopeptidase family protein [Anaerolineales bacterium]|nr:peptidoglycan DD-metalloendopeptidase family protein [Anaerolineales bacterium]
MKKKPVLIFTLLTISLVMVSISCQLIDSGTTAEESAPAIVDTSEDAQVDPTATPQVVEPQEPTSLPPTEAPAPEDTPEPEPTLPQVEAKACEEAICLESGTFLLERPIAPTGRNTIDPSYRYGDYRHSTQLTHRGVDFLNSTGTLVLAAANGEVVVAGDDLNMPYGPRKNFYGNLVILGHELPGYSEPIYTLYAHLSEVMVEVGDLVSAGDEIGLVGMSGGVPGSTLHFEVRVGENSYLGARNPELWLVLLSDQVDQSLGSLAGRVLNDQGKYEPVENIVVEQLAGPGLPAIDQFYLRTYEKKELLGQSPWNESFALSDLPAGEYQITFMLNGVQQQVVEVEPGKLTLVTFEIN